MRKWVIAADMIMLCTCLALLVIDLKIKNDMVRMAQEVREARYGPGATQEFDSVRDNVPGDIPGDNLVHDAPVAVEDTPEASVNGTGPRSRGNASKRGPGNSSARVPAENKRMGS